MKRLLSVLATIGLLTSVQAAEAAPLVIQYRAVDLANDPGGDDFWQYQYFLSGFDFVADQGFAIDFDPTLYASLEDPPPPVNTGWDAVAFQPAPDLPLAGAYDALALVDGPTLVDPFTVTFKWLGAPGTTPGSQVFSLYQLDADGFLSPLASGVTVPRDATPVPEPSTLLLLASGIAAAARRRWRRVDG